MSPEQAEGRQVDARSDVFSFGAVLYEMLTGPPAVRGGSTPALISAILRDQPPPIRSVRPRCLRRTSRPSSIARSQRIRRTRYADGAAMHAELAAAQARLTRSADCRWRRRAVLVPVALAVLAAAAFGVWQMVQARDPLGPARGDSRRSSG